MPIIIVESIANCGGTVGSRIIRPAVPGNGLALPTQPSHTATTDQPLLCSSAMIVAQKKPRDTGSWNFLPTCPNWIALN